MVSCHFALRYFGLRQFAHKISQNFLFKALIMWLVFHTIWKLVSVNTTEPKRKLQWKNMEICRLQNFKCKLSRCGSSWWGMSLNPKKYVARRLLLISKVHLQHALVFQRLNSRSVVVWQFRSTLASLACSSHRRIRPIAALPGLRGQSSWKWSWARRRGHLKTPARLSETNDRYRASQWMDSDTYK